MLLLQAVLRLGVDLDAQMYTEAGHALAARVRAILQRPDYAAIRLLADARRRSESIHAHVGVAAGRVVTGNASTPTC
jgi:class 3 adenylate cyclase